LPLAEREPGRRALPHTTRKVHLRGAKVVIEQTTRYGIGTVVDMPYEMTLDRVREALGEQGFGVLTEIDVRATLGRKLGVDFKPYMILGACNPPLAHEALTAEPDIGLLLPCNVVVYATEQEGRTAVAALDPEEALALSGNKELGQVAAEVKRRLRRALEHVEHQAGSLAN